MTRSSKGHWLHLILACCLGGAGATSLSGQVVGRVQTVSGTPLPNVLVEAWGASERLASTLTDGAGAFRFDSAEVAAGLRVSFSHVGYHTAVHPVQDLGRAPVVTLETLPVALPGIVALSVEERCPASDDTEARGLWKAAASKYSDLTGRRGGGALQLRGEGHVMDHSLGRFDEEDLRRGVHEWAGSSWPSAPGRYALVDSLISRRGYAWPAHTLLMPVSRRTLNWAYPVFEEREAYHFRTEVFGALHTFSILDRTDEGFVLGFCPVGDEKPTIRGTLRLGADTTFTEARWSFHTPEPDENAGGEVVFSPFFDTDERPHLMAARGVFWRHDGKEPRFKRVSRAYYQLVQVTEEWVVSPDERAPRAFWDEDHPWSREDRFWGRIYRDRHRPR